MGPAPIELRARFHGLFMALIDAKYPSVLPPSGVVPLCHKCGLGTALQARARLEVAAGGTFCCRECTGKQPVEMDVLDLVEPAAVTLTRVLSSAEAGKDVPPETVAALVGRVVDLQLGIAKGDLPRMWLPVPSEGKGAFVVGVCCGVGCHSTCIGIRILAACRLRQSLMATCL